MAPRSRSQGYAPRPVPQQYEAAFWTVELQRIQHGFASGVTRTVTGAVKQLVTDRLVLADPTTAPFGYTLLVPSAFPVWEVTIKNITTGGNVVTLVGTVDRTVNPTINPMTALTLMSDGLNIWIK